jgi:hypothetical protein
MTKFLHPIFVITKKSALGSKMIIVGSGSLQSDPKAQLIDVYLLFKVAGQRSAERSARRHV